ncbi:MAG: DUF423 domain-containing protein [Candidatus Parcubacteria bacterium]|uniref:DUF423 domain-containing protein n=1 Tax=Phormidesmis priestleyi TaxID=268141 RepID=UPI00083A6CCA|nr:DUF423 domain-containing protein [Phormidesmis priestleyi]MBC7825793.1 DUF423 domain-containing protein [Leptolyngbyaceae cyanobacterium LF-bin-113]
MVRVFLTIAALLGGSAVGFGAFGAHALKERLSERSLEIFETAARYQMYHALALLLVGVLMSRSQVEETFLTASGWAFIVGVVLFCGSLYALSFSGINWLGAVAPLGGLALMVGWAAIAVAAWSYK